MHIYIHVHICIHIYIRSPKEHLLIANRASGEAGRRHERQAVGEPGALDHYMHIYLCKYR